VTSLLPLQDETMRLDDLNETPESALQAWHGMMKLCSARPSPEER
jgi:hypothetical protein